MTDNKEAIHNKIWDVLEKHALADEVEEANKWKKKAQDYKEELDKLRKEFALYKEENPPKKPKAKPPPTPPQYWTTKKVSCKNTEEQGYGFTEQEWVDWKAQLTKAEKLVYLCDKEWTKGKLFLESHLPKYPIILKKQGAGQDNATKIARSIKASQECKVPDEKRCEHNKMIEGTSGKQFSRCSRKATWTLLGRRCCKAHSNQICGLASNEDRLASDFKSKRQHHLVGKEGWWICRDTLTEFGSTLSGGWFDNPYNQNQQQQLYKDIVKRRKAGELNEYDDDEDKNYAKITPVEI